VCISNGKNTNLLDIYKTFEHKSLVLSTKTKWHEYQPIQTIKQKSIPKFECHEKNTYLRTYKQYKLDKHNKSILT